MAGGDYRRQVTGWVARFSSIQARYLDQLLGNAGLDDAGIRPVAAGFQRRATDSRCAG